MNETITKNTTTGQTDLLLASLVEGCKKPRIKAIAARYDIKVSDKMTKQQMTEAIVPTLEINAGIKIKQYSHDDMKLLLRCIKNSQIDEETALQVTASAPFEDGVIFLSAKKDKISALIPKELAGKVMMHCVAHCLDSDGDALTRTARVCAMIYGTFTPEMLTNAYNAAYTENSCTAEQAESFLANANCEEFTYADGKAVYALGKPAKESPLATSLEYSLPTRREIEAYTAFGLDSTNYYYRQAVNFIYNNQGDSYDAANELMKKIAVWCVTDGNLEEIFDFVQQSEMPITASQFEFLLNILGELSDRTRKQSLKGHRHCDVEGAQPIVMPRLVVRRTESTEPAEPIRVGQKIGRNDPCPCGSGKKYKKCCGRSVK